MRRSVKAVSAIFSAATAVAGVIFPMPAGAQTIQWNAATGDFTTAADWSTGTVPGAAATADVTNSGVCTISAADTVSVTQLWAGDTAGTTSGTIVQTGGTVNASTFIAVGHAGSSGVGIYNFSGGILNQTGTTNVSDSIRLFGSASTGPGSTVMNVSDATGTNKGTVINDASGFDVGYNNGTAIGAATLNFSGGTLNMTNTGSQLAVGNGAGTTGIVNMTGGNMNISSQIWIGQSTATTGGGTGTFNLTGGNVASSTWVAIGRAGTATEGGSTGTLNISGGTFTHSNTSSGDFEVGSQGVGITATLNLTGGTLITDHISDEASSGTQTINFNGGVVQTNDNDTNYIRQYNNVATYQVPTLNVGNGGANFNTSSYTMGIALPLIHSASASSVDGGLTKYGTGTLLLSGTNTYTGPTNVLAGTLFLNGSTGSSSTVTVSSGASIEGLGTVNGPLTLNAGATLLAGNGTSGSLSAGGGLSLVGGSTIAIGNLSSYQSPASSAVSASSLSFSGGAVNFTFNGATGTVAVGNVYDLLSYTSKSGTEPSFVVSGGLPSRGVGTIADNGSGEIALTITSTDFIKWTGAINGNWDTATANWKLNSTNAATTYIDSPGDTVVFDDSATGTTSVNLTATLHPTSVTFNNSNLVYTLSGTGGIAGTLTTLTKLGSNLVTIDTSNSYGGGTAIQNGTLQLGTGGSLNASNAVVLGSGGTSGVLELGDANGPVAQTLSSLTTAGTGTANKIIGSSTAVSTLTLAVPTGTTDTYSGLIGSGSAGLTYPNSVALGKSSAGKLVLTGSNTYSGGTILNAGTININNGSALGTGAVSLTGNAVGATVGVGNGTLQAANNVTIGNNFNLGTASIVFDTNGSTLTLNGSITNTPTAATIIQPIGTGNLILAGTLNVYGSNTGSGTVDTNIPALLLASAGNTTTITGTGTLSSISMGWYNTSNTLILAPAATGVLNLPDTGPALDVGQQGGNGVIGQISGTVVSAGNLNLGKWDGAYGSYTLTGGSMTFANIYSGGKGDGNGNTYFLQTAGNVTTTGQTIVGFAGSGTSNAYLTGGTYNSVGGTFIVAQGGGGSASVTVGGTAAVTLANVYLGSASNNTSTNSILTLNSGTTTLSSIRSADATADSILNFNGGVLQANNSAGSFVNFVTAANIYSGGAIFNTAGQSVVVDQNLAGVGGTYGITTASTSIGAGGSGYIGAPVVNISGGGGTGATAVATVSGGAVTGITITNPGTGYSYSPTFTLLGGGGSGASVSASPVVNATDGGVTKLGTGTLTLSGSNTYSGPTLVKGGTLIVANPSALSTSTATLSGGATLGLAALPSLVAFSSNPSSPNYFYTNSNNTGQGGFLPVISSSGNSVLLTSAVASEATSVFSPGTYTINDSTGFAASFIYSHSVTGGLNSVADGITLIITQSSPNALGLPGGALGYAGTNASSGIQNSVAAAIDLYNDQLETGVDGTFQQASGVNTVPFISQSYALQVTVSYGYNASAGTGTLTETLTSLVNGSSYTMVTPNIDIPSLLGGSPGGSGNGYIGFTGGTGAVFDAQAVSNFSFNANSQVIPLSATNISNPISVVAGNTATIQLAPTTQYSSGAVGPITIGTGSTLAISIGSNASAGVTRGVLTVPTITFASSTSGQLDISTNALDITGESLASVSSQVKTAYANGTWTGPGITSSAAAADSSHLTAVGVILNTTDGVTPLYGSGNTLGLFDGANPAATDVLVKFTYYGDTDLSGVVDGSDYSRVDATYLAENLVNGSPTNPISGWFNGDFNYDGVVDGSDYTLMDNAFNSQGASLAASVASPTAQVGGSAVPEPATLGVLAIGAMGLLGRRRKHH
jgi:autotransporter-associated beta strand protein